MMITPYRQRSRAIAAGTAALCLVLTACSGGDDRDEDPPGLSSAVPPAKTTLNEATWIVEAEPTTLDPIYNFGYYDNTIIANLCEPLVRMNADLSTSDWLATSNQIDPLTWTYDLKPGIKFWDGSPVTPEDVVFSFSRSLGSETDSYFGSYFSRVRTVEETGPSQVTVRLSEPDALWNTSTILTAGAYIISKRFAEAAGQQFGAPGTGVMCTGPYEFSEWKTGDSITMTQFVDYWNEDIEPKTETISFEFLTDSSAQANALVSGEAQGMYIRDQTILPQLARSGGKTYFGPGLTYFFIAPTLKEGPMGDIRIRKALSKVIDREAIVKTIFGGAGVPVKALVGDDAWGPDPEVRAIYQQAYDALPDPTADADGAKKLVEQAGSPSDEIVLAYPTEGGSYQLKLASVIQDFAKRIGLNVTLKALSPAVAAQLYQDPEGMAAADIDMISLSFNVNNADPFGMYQIYDPEAGAVDNYSGFTDPEAARLLHDAAGTYDDVERARMTVAAQEIIVAQLPMIPIMSINAVLYLGEGVTGAPASFSQIWSAWATDLGGV